MKNLEKAVKKWNIGSYSLKVAVKPKIFIWKLLQQRFDEEHYQGKWPNTILFVKSDSYSNRSLLLFIFKYVIGSRGIYEGLEIFLEPRSQQWVQVL